MECCGGAWVSNSPDVVKVSIPDRIFLQKVRPFIVTSCCCKFDHGSIESRIATRAAVSLNCFLQAILIVWQALAEELVAKFCIEEV
jgi:hypothetical protein